MAFLNFNLEEVINSPGFVPIKVENYSNGDIEDGLYKEVSFNVPQLDMFDKMGVTKMPDGTIWLDLFSKKYAPNKSLMDFMAYCTEKWGPDSNGMGIPCEKDTQLLKNGKFGRHWNNIKLIQFKRDDHFALSILMRIIIDNQDMSNFVKQLAKGFVKPSVNQAGSDGGKSIPNNLYGRENKVPVSPITSNPIPPHNENLRNKMLVGGVKDGIKIIDTTPISTDVKIKTKALSVSGWLLCIALCIFFFPIGNIGVLIDGIINFFDKTYKIEWLEEETRGIPDKRYKTGIRGTYKIKVKRKARYKASKELIEINRQNGIKKISIAIITGIIIGLVIYLH